MLDDGRPVQITVFDNKSQPITAVVMIDTSGSMWPHMAIMRRAASAFAATFDEGDRARIGGFSSEQIGLSARWTRDPAELRSVLQNELWPGAFSPVWNALFAGMTAMADEPGRRVVLALTDGDNKGSVPGFGGLHHQYLIGFVPQKLDGRTHVIEVQTKKPNLKVSARTKYLAEVK